jgi:hypothetical protein
MGFEETVRSTDEFSEKIKINEIAYVWPEEVRNEKYRQLIGQPPTPGLSEEQIAEGILHPDKERERVERENRNDDKSERDSLYRR